MAAVAGRNVWFELAPLDVRRDHRVAELGRRDGPRAVGVGVRGDLGPQLVEPVDQHLAAPGRGRLAEAEQHPRAQADHVVAVDLAAALAVDVVECPVELLDLQLGGHAASCGRYGRRCGGRFLPTRAKATFPRNSRFLAVDAVPCALSGAAFPRGRQRRFPRGRCRLPRGRQRVSRGRPRRRRACRSRSCPSTPRAWTRCSRRASAPQLASASTVVSRHVVGVQHPGAVADHQHVVDDDRRLPGLAAGQVNASALAGRPVDAEDVAAVACRR